SIMAEPTVRLPGIVLASLMFQHVNSDSDVVSGSHSSVKRTVTASWCFSLTDVQKHIACHRLNTLYSSDGQVNTEELHKLLADNKQESVIGWYRQRRNSQQQMTFREKLVHENLKSALSNPHMIFVLLTPSKTTPPGSTHRMEYSAFISRSRHFVNVPVLVTNLGLLEQLSYWKVSAPCSAAGYSLTMKKHGSKFFCANGLLREVNEVDVEESERLVEALQAEVSALRTRLRERTADDPEPRKNLLLHEAVRALLASSPLFHTQTLTLQGLPVPDDDDDVSVKTAREAPPGAKNCRKRLRETLPETERKRRRSKS
uniref:BRCA1-A complex subunit Abraxas 1 n=1 Tax=Amphilophus citrinellus TaxID=61819 RepID=A0A3Q0STI0_AMPCI